MTSNVGQNYPYSSETEADRAARDRRARRGPRGAQRTSSPPRRRRSTSASAGGPGSARRKGCPGILHAAGYARDLHAVYVVCDGTCGKTFLR